VSNASSKEPQAWLEMVQLFMETSVGAWRPGKSMKYFHFKVLVNKPEFL
jgi:hypothetical protein